MSNGDFGLYIHYPFCRSRCAYCDFNTYVDQTGLIQPYTESLGAEIARSGAERRWAPVTSVYFGGGNPALVGAQGLLGILDGCRKNFEFDEDVEISVEVNPEDARPGFLEQLVDAGFNRISLGWQTLCDQRLSMLNRRHDSRQALESLETASTSGFSNISVDLIFGLPGQWREEWRDELDAVVNAGPDHISTYALSLEPGTPLARSAAAGEIELPSEDVVAGMYEDTRRFLRASGFNHYEISNFAAPGQACRHNLNYWLGGDYLGFGAGAHSHIGGRRSWRVLDPREFIAAAGRAGTEAGAEQLDERRRMGERIFLGLRLPSGVNLTELETDFKLKVGNVFGAQINRLQDEGLLALGRNLRLTERGLLLANEAMVEFV